MTSVASPELAQPAKTRQRGAQKAEIITTRVWNVRLLLITAVLVVVGAPALYFWHSFQVERSATAFLDRAKHLEKQGEWNKASSYIFNYLRVHPDDVEVRVHLAKTFDKAAGDDPKRKMRAAEFYARAVGLAPDRVELRRRLAELQLEMGQFTAAVEEAKLVLAAEPNDPVAMRVYATSEYYKILRNTKDQMPLETVVDELFKPALLNNPGDVKLSVLLARIYREELTRSSIHERAEDANNVMNRLVAAASGDPEAYLARYYYRLQYNLSGTEEDIEKAVEVGPEDFNALITAAAHGVRKGREIHKEKRYREANQYYLKAIEYYTRAIKITPSDERGHLGLGQAYLAQGKAGLAIDAWEKGLDHVSQENIELNARLASTLIALKRFDDVEKLLDLLDRSLEKLAASRTDFSGPRRKQAESAVRFLRAKWRFGLGQHRQTVAILDEVIQVQAAFLTTARAVSEHYDAYMMRGESYEKIGQFDQAAADYEHAGTIIRPNDKVALDKLRSVLTQQGRHESLLADLEKRFKDGSAGPGDWLFAIEIRLKQQLQVSEEQRDWREVEKLFRNAPVPLRSEWQYLMLAAEYVMASEGSTGEAKAASLLQKAETLHASNRELFQRLPLVYHRLNMTEDADRTLTNYRRIVGDGAAYTLAEVQLLAARKQLNEAQQALQAALAKASDDEKGDLQQLLTQILLQTDLKAGKSELLKLHEADPTNTTHLSQLAELALETGALDEVRQWEAKLKEVEGNEGTNWRYYRARRLVAQAKSGDSPELLEAASLQQDIVGKRSNWPASHLLGAMIAMREGSIATAIDGYRRAIQLGDRRVAIYEALIDLLINEQQFDEAEQHLALLKDRVPLVKLLDFGIRISVGNGQTARAVHLAEKAIAEAPNDPIPRLRLAQTLAMSKENEKAEAAFAEARKLAPDSIQVWNALLAFYVNTGQREAALRTLEAFPKESDVSNAQRALILAQGYEIVGDRKNAEKRFHEALKLEPNNMAIELRFARFQAASDTSAAKQTLRGVLKGNPENGEARRMLASLLAGEGEEGWQEARRLLGGDAENLREEKDPVSQRLLANILARHGKKDDLQQAQKLLEDLIRDPFKVTPGDRLLLARIYESQGSLQAARIQLTTLCNGANPNPSHIAQLVDFLLRNNDRQRGELWLKKLLELDPDSFNTLTRVVRWLQNSNKGTAIEPRVETFAKAQLAKLNKDSEKLRLCQAVGNLYSSAEMHEAALRWYRIVEKSNPEAYPLVVRALAANGKFSEAVQICSEKAKSDKTPKPAIVLGQALTAGKPGAQDFRLAEPVFTQALNQHPDNIDLLFSLAYVRTVEEKIDEAVRLYQKIYDKQPKHVPTLNNLAAVLSERGDADRSKEALEYIDRAISIAGHQPALLDTKGMVVFDDDPVQAVQLFEEATSTPASDPRYHLHLAAAYLRSGSVVDGGKALEAAYARGLKDHTLTPKERRLLDELERTVGR